MQLQSDQITHEPTNKQEVATSLDQISLDDLRESLRTIVSQQYTPQLAHNLHVKLRLSDTIAEAIKAYMVLVKEEEDRSNIIDAILGYKEKLGESLADISKVAGSLDFHFDHFFGPYQDAVKAFCQSYPETIIQVQSADRYRYLESDTLGSKLVKSIKIPSFWVVDSFQKLVGRPGGYQKHEIPLHKMVEFYFFDELAKKTAHLLEISLETACKYADQLHDLTKEVDFKIHQQCLIELQDLQSTELTQEWNDLLEEYKDISKALKSAISEIEIEVDYYFTTVFETFADALFKVDTLELLKGYFTPKSIALKRQKVNETFGQIYLKTQNHLFVIFEDWRFDQDVFMLRFTLAKMRLDAKRTFDQKTTLTLIQHIDHFVVFLKNHFERLKHIIESDFEIDIKLQDEKKYIEKELKAQLEVILKFIKKENLPGIIDNIQDTLNFQLKKLPLRHTIILHDDFEIEFDKAHIIGVLPFEIINFELMPTFFQNITKVKAHLQRSLQMTEQTTSEVFQICRLNTKSLFKAEDSKEKQQILDVIHKELNRDIDKLEKLQKDLQNLDEYFYTNLTKSADEFTNKLVILTEHENVIEVFEKIEKRNSKNLSKQTRKSISDFWINLPPVMLKGFGNTVKSIIQYNIDLGEKYGFIPLDTKTNSIKVDDFLETLNSSLQKLPYVYERLYRIEALDNKNLFLWRESELNQLGDAYNHWLNDRFSSTLICSEKGAGATTLINMFVQRVKPQYRLIKIHQTPHLSNPQDFLDFFKDKLPQKSAKDLQSVKELIDYLIKLPRKHIIIIENIEHLFLRSVDGFDTFKIFLELMAKTNKNILWICTCTKYAWQYLDNAQDINKFFGNVIEIQPLSHDSIRQVILKRHQMSGFALKFESRQPMAEDRQEYLENDYFERLGNFVKGNVSLAFLFWLRSTKKVVGDTIYINFLDELNDIFFEDISQNMQVALNTLLIHNGLDEALLAKVMRLSPDEAKLLVLQLLEEKIITQEEDKYIINPLLYRQVTQMLTQKNFIH